MTQVSRPARALMALGLVALATSTASSDASAFAARGSFGGFHAPSVGHVAGIGRMPSGGGGFFGARRPSPVHAIPVFVSPSRFPGRLPPIFHGPRLPPIFRGPRLPPIVIGYHPHPGWPPIVINHYPHRWPIIPVGGPIVVPAAVAVGVIGGGIATRVEAAPVSVGGTCAISGSFVSVVFLPTATVADVTAFLKTYNVTMADGPNVDGIYRIRLSDVPLPENRIVELVTSMRSQAAIVAQVNG